MNYQDEYTCLGCPCTDTCDRIGCIRLLNYHKSLDYGEEIPILEQGRDQVY